MKKLTRIAKVLGIVIVGLVLVLTGLFAIYNEDLPAGGQPEAADALANKMLKAVNHEAYKTTEVIEWTFVGQHHYQWFKQENRVDVKWDKTLVHLNLQHPDSSVVLKNNIEIKDESKSEIIQKAVDFFNNDSFWLVAPHKVFDPGTERKIVPLENGEQGLLVSYTSGGSTPGDSYLWILDESGLPKAFKMWVSVIPLGGLEATWDNWTKAENGALFPTNHKMLFLTIALDDVTVS
ncbi:MAG: hypothetical protein ACJAV5_001074 [Vicingaceae bacterium]|jgi:hypothetical protein